MPAIRVQSLSKRYRHDVSDSRRQTLCDSIGAACRHPWRQFRRALAGRGANGGGRRWVLRDVSFEVEPGQVVGIIGRNGAGKSTLLKILSRITEPTSGHAWLRGRVGSLLEIGTGFHGELSGEENVYLNGAILGMTRAEMARKFADIVAFAEVGDFLGTAVKHYSTGMRMRLAFAVAVHCTPDILLLDEVLAVGDASFQRKCIQKMEEVGAAGRTVVLVSHNLTAVSRLCQRVIWLHDGAVAGDGPAHQIVADYLRGGIGPQAQREWPDATTAPGSAVVRLCAVRVGTDPTAATGVIDIRRPVLLTLEYQVLTAGHVLMPVFQLNNEDGIVVFSLLDQDRAWCGRPRPAGRYTSQVAIPGNLLAEGTLFVGAAMITPEPLTVHCHERDAVAFQVIDSFAGDSARGAYAGALAGVVRPTLPWQTHFQS